MPRVNARLPANKKKRFTQYCERIGKTQSDVINEMIDDVIGKQTDDNLPEDETLANIYLTLWNMRETGYGGNLVVEVDESESKLANSLNIPKQTIRSRYLSKLRSMDYITLRTGINNVWYQLDVPLDEQLTNPNNDQ